MREERLRCYCVPFYPALCSTIVTRPCFLSLNLDPRLVYGLKNLGTVPLQVPSSLGDVLSFELSDAEWVLRNKSVVRDAVHSAVATGNLKRLRLNSVLVPVPVIPFSPSRRSEAKLFGN